MTSFSALLNKVYPHFFSLSLLRCLIVTFNIRNLETCCLITPRRSWLMSCFCFITIATVRDPGPDAPGNVSAPNSHFLSIIVICAHDLAQRCQNYTRHFKGVALIPSKVHQLLWGSHREAHGPRCWEEKSQKWACGLKIAPQSLKTLLLAAC